MNKIIFPLRPRMRREVVVHLQDGLELLLGKGVFPLSDAERQTLEERLRAERAKRTYGQATAKLVKLLQEQRQLEPTGAVDEPTAKVLNDLLKERGALVPASRRADSETFQVKGKVASRVSSGVGGLRVRIVDKTVGSDFPLAEALTDDNGSYQVTFTDADLRMRGKARPDLQARVFAGDSFLAASDVSYNASNRETLDVLLDENASSALRSEYETLTAALATHFKGKLGDLTETNDRQDITYLANKTGWDARAVALAALADQFSAQTEDAKGAQAIPQAFFYALFRAGLPANEDTLYHTDAKTLEGVWKAAAEQGVIPKASVDQIPNLVARFQALSAQELLTGPVLVGASSLKGMLAVSRLDDAQQKQFAGLYATHRTDMAQFWDSVASSFGAETANRLQVDGKLAFLTINNAPLMQKVHTTTGANGLSDPLELAQMGYHRAEPWSQLLTPDVPIPKEIPGNTSESKRANYSAYLAAQVRLSYPTAAVAQMVKSGELPLTGAAPGDSDNVHAFLTEHQGEFEIGVQPVEQYVKRNHLEGNVASDTVAQIKRLQRVYQITPSDQAMIGLIKRGIDSAYQVVRYDKDTFIRSYAAPLGGAGDAALTYNKSVQVHNAVLNIALSYLTARTAPAIGVHSPASVLAPAPANAGDVIALATLESLFGSMDFCDCEHCRSILSPAAYLVDLLLFLHADEQEWTAFCIDWRSKHDSAPYPFPDQTAWNTANQPADTEISPLNVLLSRRPDIEHLPLTCENTNTALPYIDVVNETLEYFIANSSQPLSLRDYAGYDTDGMASEDLLASPQFVIASAYTTLQNERFPSPLPFHQPLENLRRYFNKFEVPLPLAMERLRQSDNLEHGAQVYGWRDILMEEIGLSRDEYEILTDSNAVSLWRMYGFPNGTADADVIAGLSNAKEYARRLEIAYEDLIAILRTRFVNPSSDLIPRIEKLGITFSELKYLQASTASGQAWLDLLPQPLPDAAEYGGNIETWVKDATNYNNIVRLIALTVPAGSWASNTQYTAGDCVRPTLPSPDSTLYYQCTQAGTSAATEPNPWPTVSGVPYTDGLVIWTCLDVSNTASFDNLAFRYADPDKLTQNIAAVEFARLLRFIRLWKKLGWSIEQTDAAICALYPLPTSLQTFADTVDSLAKLDAGFLTLLPRLGIISRVMKALNLRLDRDLLPLLTCWSEIGTHGDTALYRQMFLSPALLKQDPVFADNGYGEFLTNTLEKLPAHAEALRSAFNLSGDEYDRIAASISYDANTTLTIANVSAIYRRGWLARKLKLSVRELLLLIQLTSLDPFAAPNLTDPAILRLVSLVQSLKDRSLNSAAALYLIWNQDLSGKSTPGSSQVAALARMLRLGFAAVETEFAMADDPDGAIAQTRMAMVYGPDASAFFFGLLNDILTVEVEFGDPDGTLAPGATRQAIDNAAGKTDVGNPRIAYDDFRKRLLYSGVLTTATRDAIKLAGGVGSTAFNTAVDNMYSMNQSAINPFFAGYPELRPPYDAYVADATHSVTEKRSNLLKAILPELVRRRKRQQALQSVSAVANADLAFAQAFLDPPAAPFPLQAVGHSDQPALTDLLILETPGLSVQFIANDTAMGAIISSPDIARNLDYAPVVGGDGNPLPANPAPNAAISGVWSGYVEAPENGFFNLRIEADAGATVTLLLDDKPVALLPQDATLWVNADPIELRAATLHRIKLTVEKVRNVVRVSWDWSPNGQGRVVIPARYLYPATLFDRFQEAYVRFLKVASLSTGLGLTLNEMAYFATDAAYRINAQGQIDPNGQGWLNALPSADNLHLANAADAAIAQNLNAALLIPLCALLDFGRIKASISPSDETLLTALKDPTEATQSSDSLLFTITRWNPTSLNDVLGRFGGNIAGLGHLDLFHLVYDALALTQEMGISARALIQATTNEPTTPIVSDLQSALRARYDPADWRDVVRPINDEMRSLQRNALVAYILHQMRSHPESAHIDTPDKLFEYFLMDVQMEPCMETSRIRHALSSVQLFIERCLMTLEPRVSPVTINTEQWAWMKRYRVWEANRKVCLFPENWLEPELRDNKSPFFKEVESELLQSDITEDSATTALLNYLSKLEEVAKLEPCGIYHLPANEAKGTSEIDHVVARTAGANRKYYYRRYESYWTPWEQIKLDIEDNPVIPVVWKDRLFLFWLRILKQGLDTVQKPFMKEDYFTSLQTSDIKTDPPLVTVQAVLCWSEYYNGKWQPTKTSDVNAPTWLDTSSSNLFNRTAIRLGVAVEGDALRVYIRETPFRFYMEGRDVLSPFVERWPGSFLFYNTHSLPIRGDDEVAPVPPPSAPVRRRALAGIYKHDFAIMYSENTGTDFTREILTTQIPLEYINPRHQLLDIWNAPFFSADSRHVFLVTTEEQPVWVRSYRRYGIFTIPGVLQAARIPPLVVQTAPLPKSKPWGGGGSIGPDRGVVDPAPMQRFVTEDAYIRQGLGSTLNVKYGDRQIGPSGAIANGSTEE